MPHSLVPVNIKPHLVPFLYQHFKTQEKAQINGKCVKSVSINTRSALGKIIRLLAQKSDKKKGCDTTYSIFLSLEDTVRGKKYFGNFYKYQSGEHSFLEFNQEGVKLINELLEQELQNAMMFFIFGFQNKDGEMGLIKGIHIFIKKYHLFEYGYDVAAIRRSYYRWLEKITQVNSVM